jgi:hypothetical protein
MRPVLALLLALTAAPGCGAFSPGHCGYLEGGPTCAARDPARPYCDICRAADDGCVAAPVTDEACVLRSDPVTGPPTTEPPGTTTGEAPTTTLGPTSPWTTTGEPSGATTGETTAPVTSTTTGETTAESSTGTTTTTGDDTSTGTTTGDGESTSTGTGETTEDDPQVCGDGELDDGEPCDGEALAGKLCVDFPGKGGGVLGCSDECTYDVSGCCLADDEPCDEDEDCCEGSECVFDLLALEQLCKS